MNLQLRGMGEKGPAGGQRYISIGVEEDAVFERDGADVHVKVRLRLAEALLGGKIIIPTLKGDVRMNVPPGTQTGDRRVMTGRGIAASERSAGHQYVHFGEHPEEAERAPAGSSRVRAGGTRDEHRRHADA